jgi:dTDP-4-dehydrorhamnose 3,5-epimerase
MKFVPTPVHGVTVVDLDIAEDERGFFARTFCQDEFTAAGIEIKPCQLNLSHNAHAFTLRGLHFQAKPHGENKLVHCVRGRIFDVAVDLRSDSPSYRRWFGIELAPHLRRLLYVPKGCAHGFLTLEPESDVSYVMGQPFVAEAGRGVRWDDPAFGIDWPTQPQLISSRDRSFPDFSP